MPSGTENYFRDVGVEKLQQMIHVSVDTHDTRRLPTCHLNLVTSRIEAELKFPHL